MIPTFENIMLSPANGEIILGETVYVYNARGAQVAGGTSGGVIVVDRRLHTIEEVVLFYSGRIPHTPECREIDIFEHIVNSDDIANASRWLWFSTELEAQEYLVLIRRHLRELLQV